MQGWQLDTWKFAVALLSKGIENLVSRGSGLGAQAKLKHIWSEMDIEEDSLMETSQAEEKLGF